MNPDRPTQATPKNLRRTKSQKAAREDLWLNAIMLIVLVGLGLFAFLTPRQSPEYVRSQNTMFLGCIIIILATFALMRLHRTFWSEVVRVLRNDVSVTQAERSNALWALAFVLALVGILFVDVHSSELRLTVVTGTALARSLWAIIRGR